MESSSRSDLLGLDRVNADRFYFGLASPRRYETLAGLGRLETVCFWSPSERLRTFEVCPLSHLKTRTE